MLDFAIFAATFAVALIIAVIYLYPGSSRPTTIPGLDPTTKQDGNLADISRVGSVHDFLVNLHNQYGAIASFWMGQKQVVSIASPELFKDHQNVFDRPSELFLLFEPLIGPLSMFFANGSEGRRRRAMYDSSFTEEAVKQHTACFQKIASNLLDNWSKMSDQHIPLQEHMIVFSVKTLLLVTMGDYFNDDQEIIKLRRHFDTCWLELERRLTDVAEPESHRQKAFDDGLDVVKETLSKAILHRKNMAKKEKLLVDWLNDSGASDDQVLSDCLTTVTFGFHALGSYIQEKVVKEIKEVIGNSELNNTNLEKLKYLFQVMNETNRCAVLRQWAARTQRFDSELGGHKIPKSTPVIHALGVVMQDENLWPLPNRFDPNRFSPANMKMFPSMAFQPFGFAGKRLCPASNFSYIHTAVCLVVLLRKLQIGLVDGQVVTPVYGLVTHPEDEVWITATKRR